MTAQLLHQYILDAEKAFEQQEWLEAKGILEQALQEEPTYAMAHNHMGWLYVYWLVDYQLAEMHLKLAMKYAPQYHATYMHMAQLLFEAKRLDELNELLIIAINVPGVRKSFIYNDLGRINEVRGKMRQAVKFYKKAAVCSLDEYELQVIRDNIRRCRQKRWITFW